MITLDQDSPSKKIEIRAPKSFSGVDVSIWEELEKFLFQGFLISHATINNQSFVFKTINHLELRQIDFMRPYVQSSSEKHLHFRAAFIAYSVFMANGNNILHERERNLVKLVKMISKLNGAHQDKIFENLSALNEKASRLYPLTEVYSFENRSRFKWNQMNSAPINSTLNTGTSGTDFLGMNSCQSLWVALNKIYDKREEIEKDWTHAKFVGSCMAGKGIRSIDDRDKMRHEKEKNEREDLRSKVLRAYLNRSIVKNQLSVETVTLPDGRVAEVAGRFRADSAEELARQLQAAVNNEKDAHDLAVEAHFKSMFDRQQEIENEKRKLIGSSVQRIPDNTSQTISRDEAEMRIRRLREAMLNSDKQIIPDLNSSNSDTK